ncbi:hypothetical protein EDD18DRAFT_1355055 [Armillaria luteobubalina]|uniref:Uncharacterized protein n=1 Tax=Armillaria luteobubalina TaxID=153913 RepID=A0AA39Q4I7_9AGAR|nr:hypothetical protein EDD18DRAFT_1355055 [Armillaria luteobubalina]
MDWCYLYYLAFLKDRKFTKYLVYGIYIIEFVQTILITHDAFAVFRYGFGDWEALISEHYWFVIPIMIGITVSAGQGIYAYRIFVEVKLPQQQLRSTARSFPFPQFIIITTEVMGPAL